MDFRDKNGDLIFRTDNGTRKFVLMGDDYITLKINTDSPFYPPVGSYCECDFGRFELTKESNAAPTVGNGYNYSVQLDNQYIKWNNKLFMWRRGMIDETSNFSVAVNLTGAMDLILTDLKALGSQYRFKGVKKGYSYNIYSEQRTLEDGYVIEGIDKASEVKTLQFDGMYLLDALYYIAKQWNTECWIEDSIINIGKCENTSKVTMERSGNGNIDKISRSDSQGTHATRLYVYGGTTNVPARYRKTLIFTTQDGTSIPNKDFSPVYFPDSLKEGKPGNEGKGIVLKGGTDIRTYSTGSSVDADVPMAFPATLKAARGNYRVDMSKLNVQYDYPAGALLFRSVTVTLDIEFADGHIVTAYPETTGGIGSSFKDDTLIFDTDIDLKPARTVTLRFKGTNSYANDPLTIPGAINVQKTFTFALRISGTIDFYFSGEKVATRISVLTAPNKPELSGTKMDCVFNPSYAPDSSDEARKMSVTLPAGTTFTIDGILEEECPVDWFYSQGSSNINRENRLQLDGPLVSGDGDEETYVDAQIIHEDIFPRMKDHYLTSVEKGTASTKDEEGKEYKYTTYKVKDDKLIGFKEKYILQGEELKMNFSGELHDNHVPLLAGLTIPVKFNEVNNTFELIRTKIGDAYFPNDNSYPQVGDNYTLTGYDASYMAGELTKEAEAELKEQGLKDLEQYKVDNNSTYNVTLFTYEGNFYQAGTRVDLISKGLFKDADKNTRKSRVMGYELDMAIPTKAPVYTVGEAEVYSRLQEIENKIEGTNKGSFAGNGNGSGNSVYVIGRGDSTQPTDTNVYSAARSDSNYLRKDQPDKTNYPVDFNGGINVGQNAKFGDTIDSFIAGKGTLITPNGRIQTDRIEVRQSMTVMDLIINQIQGMASDFDFTDVAKVSAIEKIDDTTYKLYIEKKTDFDVMPFRENDIIRQVVNTLPLGGAQYYTSWMRVLTTDSNENSIQASIYPDSEVPGGKNYVPAAGYNVGRRGNTRQEDGNERAGSWYLSSLEGRIAFLMNVYKPVLEQYNYGLAIGNLPDIDALHDIPANQRKMGILAQTIVARHFYQRDWNGKIMANRVERGAWSLDVAKSDRPYRNIQYRWEGGKESDPYTLLEQHVVERFGATWGCIVDKTLDEPRWNSQGWEMLVGDPNYYLDILSTAGKAVLVNSPQTTLVASVRHANEDITDDVMADAGTVVEWFRDTGNAPEDNAWLPSYAEGKPKNHIDIAYKDMGSGWGFSYRKVTFTCRVTIPVGNKTETAENEIGFNI